MSMHRVSSRGAAEVVVALLFVPVLATCTPVLEPAHCGDGGNKQCSTSSPATRVREDAAVAESACARDADCDTSGPCEMARCESSRCVRTPVPSGMLLPEPDQVLGDCRSIECDGNGGSKVRSDDADRPMSDGNPCHARSCANGEIVTMPLADGSDCNAGGVCAKGECSKCRDGADCTGVADCSVMRVRCDGGKTVCESRHEPISGKICGSGKVCSDGACTECRVGASCGESDPCYVSRITSCDPRVCERSALTGPSCGSDAAGHAQVCNAGKCGYACDKTSCKSASNSCMQNVAICEQPEAEAICSSMPSPDGSACESNGTCHNGVCGHTVLQNGDFSQGLSGWKLTGDAANFQLAQDPSSYQRWTVSTKIDGAADGGGRASGTISQTFVVPNDAVAVRFNVSGGEGSVQLRDANGNVLERVVGSKAVNNPVPVSWDLSTRRGQTLTLAIVDDIASDSSTAYVSSTGFDVIRAAPSALVNADFHDGLTGWDATGDGMSFNVYTDWNLGVPEEGMHDDAYGRRVSVSTYTRAGSGASRLGIPAVGTISQTFTVPADATALRFNVCGGKRTHVALYDGATQLNQASPNDDDALKVPISWDLTAQRGKALRVVAVDEVGSDTTDYLGTTGFDIITAYNGP